MGVARAKQIEVYCLKLFYQHISSYMTRLHFKIFLFLHSILLNEYRNVNKNLDFSQLSIIFKMLNSSLEENEELSDKLNEEIKKPSNLSYHSWKNFLNLEKINPEVFKDLSKSLNLNNDKWIEYFNIDKSEYSRNDLTEKEVDLINNCPLAGFRCFARSTSRSRTAGNSIRPTNARNYSALGRPRLCLSSCAGFRTRGRCSFCSP